MRSEKWNKAVQARIAQSKARLLEEFRKMPILQIALERASVKSRSTYYEWREKDKEFCKEADQAIAEGEALITDMSESQLITLIREKYFPALQLWLRHHHPKFRDKLEITGDVTHRVQRELTEEEKELRKEALRLGLPKSAMLEEKEKE